MVGWFTIILQAEFTLFCIFMDRVSVNVNKITLLFAFYTSNPDQVHNSGGVLWFHIGHQCVCPSIVRRSVRLSQHFRLGGSIL